LRDPSTYLDHMLKCIGLIEDYSKGGMREFLGDRKTQDAVIRNLQTIAESAKRLPDTMKDKHPEVSWKAVGGLRNVLVHDYLGVDVKQVWEIVSKDLPGLKRALEAMKKEA